MYEIKVISEFSSAHMLRHYKGKCENVHGHNWKTEVYASSGKLDRAGMVADFKKLKAALNSVLDGLDHKNLNDIPYFKKVNPTSENIAKYIYEKVRSRSRPKISKVTVWESDSACASYTP